jgi:hypothetical protein
VAQTQLGGVQMLAVLGFVLFVAMHTEEPTVQALPNN